MENIIRKILNKHNINYNLITKSKSGFSNNVYFIDDKYVIKITKETTDPEKLKKEISFYKNITTNFIPRYLASGIIDNKEYLITSQIKGKNLYQVWHTLTNEKRISLTKQIAEILKQLHIQDHSFLSPKYIFLNSIERWKNSFEITIKQLKNLGYNTNLLQKFKNNYIEKLFKEDILSLVYNDAHFDNFIYNQEEDKLYLIDFDRVVYTSLDYELLIITLMTENPSKFANEEDEQFTNKDDYKDILPTLKHSYATLFEHPYLNERMSVYKFISNINNMLKFETTEEISTEIKNFTNHFYN